MHPWRTLSSRRSFKTSASTALHMLRMPLSVIAIQEAPRWPSSLQWRTLSACSVGCPADAFVQNTSLACTHMLRIPLSVKSRFRKRPAGVLLTLFGGTWMNCG
jgi:hypothetical protein